MGRPAGGETRPHVEERAAEAVAPVAVRHGLDDPWASDEEGEASEDEALQELEPASHPTGEEPGAEYSYEGQQDMWWHGDEGEGEVSSERLTTDEL